MKKVYINENGPLVSAAIYGFYRWGQKELADKALFDDTVNYALDLGINGLQIDSVHKTEVAHNLGSFLKTSEHRRDSLVISAKIGLHPFEGGGREGFYPDLRPSSIQKQVETTLLNIGTDYLDIVVLEQVDYLHQFEQTASALLKLQRAGKVKHFGVSGFNVFQQRLLSQSLSQPIIANQLDFNLLEVSALKDGRIDFIKEQYSSPIASSPLANGRIFNGQDDQAIRLRRALIEVGRKYDANVEQTAVAWLQKLGALPLIGTLEKHRIQNAATASNIELTHEDWYYLLQQAS
jgi:predicted oxidoreductase